MQPTGAARVLRHEQYAFLSRGTMHGASRAEQADERASQTADARRRRGKGCRASFARRPAAEQSVARGAGRIGGESHRGRVSDESQAAQRQQHVKKTTLAQSAGRVDVQDHIRKTNQETMIWLRTVDRWWHRCDWQSFGSLAEIDR